MYGKIVYLWIGELQIEIVNAELFLWRNESKVQNNIEVLRFDHFLLVNVQWEMYINLHCSLSRNVMRWWLTYKIIYVMMRMMGAELLIT